MSEETREKFKIDKHNLDDEVNRQVDLMDDTGRRHADLVEKRDLARNRVDITKANLDAEIREEYKGEKITEKKIENMILVHTEYQKEYKEYLRVRRGEQLAANEKEMAMQRRAYLKLLGELWIASYYGDPEIKETLETKNIRGRRK